MRSRATFALAVLLAVSVAFNVRSLVRRSPAPAPAARPSASAAAASARGEAGTCEHRLAECQRRGWEMVARSLAADRAPRPSDAPPADAPDGGPTTQAAALCARAEANLRETWQRDRELIAANLRRSLGDREEQERNLTRDLAAMREAAGLDDREAASLESAYRSRRGARITEASAALSREPQDLGAVLDAAHGLFSDEDELLSGIAGATAEEAWRAHELESRTTLLAVLATMADRDWDQSIRW
jgi:hypothetical protein